MRPSSIHRLITLTALGLLGISSSSAQLSHPDLKTIFPQGLQTGTTIEVTLGGSHLENTTALHFSHPGLRADPVTLPATEFQPARPDPTRFLISAAPEVPPGIHEVSAQTHLGLTAPRAFVVSSHPETSTGASHSPENATSLPLDTIINGHADNAAIDYYKLALTGGQSIHLRCLAQSIDSRLDPVLVLSSPDGRELARSHHFSPTQRDATLTLTAPMTGDYLLQVHDFTHTGGGEHPYRLLASSQTIPIRHRQILEPRPRPGDTPLTLGKKATHHTFEARKDHPLWIELLSAQLHHPSDPAIAVEQIIAKPDGATEFREVAYNDDLPLPDGGHHFPLRTPDPALRFDPPADGTYRLTLLNQFTQPAPAHLRLSPVSPGYQLIAVPWFSHQKDKQIPRQTTLIRQGGSARLKLFIIRRQGHHETINLTIDKLPPGVDFHPKTILPDQDNVTLTLTSKPDTAPAQTFLTIKGTSEDRTTIAQPATSSWHVGNWDTERHQIRLAQLLPLSIINSEKAPLILHPSTPTFTHKINDTLEIPFTFTKTATIKGDLTITLADLPHSKPPQVKIKPDGTEGKITLSLNPSNELKIAPGQILHFALKASFTVSHQDNLPALEAAKAELRRLEGLAETLQSESKPIPPALTAARNQAAEKVRQQTERSKPRDLTHSTFFPLTLKLTP